MGVFEHLAADDSDRRTAQRQSTAVAWKRVSDRFGAYLAAANSPSERTARLNVARGDIQEVIASACNEYGGDPNSIGTSIFKRLAVLPQDQGQAFGDDVDDPYAGQGALDAQAVDSINLEPDWEGVRAWVTQLQQTDPEVAQGIIEAMGSEAPGAQPTPLTPGADYTQNSTQQDLAPGNYTASIHEARRPKMCPYHREVTDISLASGEPAAGFNAMAQHAWGAQHCQGEGYEGRCNFKPAMTTQKFWDDKAEQAQQRAEERAQQRELEQQQSEEITEITDEVPDDASELGDQTAEPVVEDSGINAELAEAPSAVGQGAEPAATLEPMAASTKEGEALETIDIEKDTHPDIDKSKIPADGLPEVDAEMEGSPHPTERIDPLVPLAAQNEDEDFLKGTRAVTETQDVEKQVDTEAKTDYTWGGNNGASPVTSSDNAVRDLMEKGLLPDNQVEAAIKEFEDA